MKQLTSISIALLLVAFLSSCGEDPVGVKSDTAIDSTKDNSNVVVDSTSDSTGNSTSDSTSDTTSDSTSDTTETATYSGTYTLVGSYLDGEYYDEDGVFCEFDGDRIKYHELDSDSTVYIGELGYVVEDTVFGEVFGDYVPYAILSFNGDTLVFTEDEYQIYYFLPYTGTGYPEEWGVKAIEYESSDTDTGTSVPNSDDTLIVYNNSHSDISMYLFGTLVELAPGETKLFQEFSNESYMFNTIYTIPEELTAENVVTYEIIAEPGLSGTLDFTKVDGITTFEYYSSFQEIELYDTTFFSDGSINSITVVYDRKYIIGANCSMGVEL